MIRVQNLSESLVEDLVSVCTPAPRSGIVEVGVEIKRRWASRMLGEYGSIAKVGYLGDRPVAQLLYYPEAADPTGYGRRDVLVVHCIYNPYPEAQGRGIARRMVEELLREAKAWRWCRFIVTHAFETGEHYSQRLFFEKMGFRRVPGGSPEDLYLPLRGGVLEGGVASAWREGAVHEVFEDDRGRVIAFYTPVCQYGYAIAHRAAQLVREVDPHIPVELVNSWEMPGEYLARGRNWLVVNGVPVRAAPFNAREFIDEVRRALRL